MQFLAYRRVLGCEKMHKFQLIVASKLANFSQHSTTKSTLSGGQLYHQTAPQCTQPNSDAAIDETQPEQQRSLTLTLVNNEFQTQRPEGQGVASYKPL